MDLSRRGKFTLSMEMIRASNTRVMGALFRDIIVLEARPLMVESKIEYWAVSQLFDKVESCVITPEYEAEIMTFLDHHPAVRWRRVPDGTLLPLVYEDWGRAQE